MSRRLASALDDCIARLRLGEALDDILQSYPDQRDELEPLLSMASQVSASYAPASMSPQAFSRNRAQFLSEAVRIKEQESQPRASWLSWGSHPLLARGLATVFIVVAMMAGLFTGGNIVSANSLPGDTLYGVKRTSEQVQLWLTVDSESKAELEEQFSERRVDEVRQVLDEGRQVSVDFSGVIDRIEGDMIVVEGIPVRLDPKIVFDATPTVGDAITVVAEAQEDGSVRATFVDSMSTETPQNQEPVIAPPTKEPSATPTQEPTKAPTEPPTPTDTPEPTVTNTATDSPTLTVEPTETLLPTVTETATATWSPTVTDTPEPTLTLTPQPPPQTVKVRIEGLIDEIEDSHWRVAGQKVQVKSSTSINEDAAKAQVGGWAIVTAEIESDGSLVARKIEVLRSAEEEPTSVEFTGEVQEIGEAAWVIAGQTVEIDNDTVIEGTPRLGAGAYVKAERYADGSLVAKLIRVEDEPVIVQFEGRIQAIADAQWTIAGQMVLITADTEIDGEPIVGAIAEVEAVVQEDDSLVARSISVRALQPTATPVAEVPTATTEPTETTTVAPTEAITPTEEPSMTPTETSVPTEESEEIATPDMPVTPQASGVSAWPTRSLEGTRNNTVQVLTRQEAE